jgi:hypothetical protein
MIERDSSLLALSDLKKGRLYKLKSRNLLYGVFDGGTGFIGIREKLGSRFLDREHHWDVETYGTVSGLVDTEIDIPSDMNIDPVNEKLFNFINDVENLP